MIGVAAINTIILFFVGVFVYFALPHIVYRVGVVAMFIALAFLNYISVFEAQGLPKPIDVEWRNLKGSEILALTFGQDGQVYVWVDREGLPVGYVFPPLDNKQQQSALEDAFGSKERTGAQFYVSGQDGEVADVEMPENPPPKDSQDNVLTVP